MKIRTLTAVYDGKKYYPPASEWDCRKRDAEMLIACGAAVAVNMIDPEPEAGEQEEPEAGEQSENELEGLEEA